jgi:putative two-component system response regulator
MTLESKTNSVSPSSSPRSVLSRPHLLITDDRPEVKEVVEAGLGKRYDCEFTSGLDEARDALVAGDVELAICDLQTSSEDGLAQVEEIARDYPQTAIVLITDVDDPAVSERTFEFGAHGYLVKPFWPGQLLITVKNALRRRELESALESEVRVAEERLQLLSDIAPVPIYIKDLERRYVFANRMAHQFVGMAPGQLIGLADEELMSPGDGGATAESDRRVLAGETFEAVEKRVVAGRERTFINLKFPFVDQSGAISGIAGISTDITSRQLVEALREELTRAQAEALGDLRASRQETVERLALAIESHDVDTGSHVGRMASNTALLGAKLGFDEDRVMLLRAAAPMHDVGKIAIADRILRKPGPLTPEERTAMERHTTIGHRILAGSSSELLRLAATIALTHHERWDGAGYPNGLEGEEIPLEGRIVAVADVFDALLSDRCYRPAMGVDEALTLMREGRGTQFDPKLVDLLLDNVDEFLALRG